MPLAWPAPRALSTSRRDARRPCAARPRSRPRPWRAAPAPSLLLLAVLMACAPPAQLAQQRAHHRRGAAGPERDADSLGLAFVNPWLSACDVAAPLNAPDLRGACNVSHMASWPGAAPAPAPAPTAPDADACRHACATAACAATNWEHGENRVNTTDSTPSSANTTTTSTTQCLCFLDERSATRVCGLPAGRERLRALQPLRLRACCAWGALDALRDEARAEVAAGAAGVCRRALRALLRVDALAAAAACKARDLLHRYDCQQRYSVRFGCRHCEAAYSAWACAALLPRFLGWGTRVRPCRTTCQRVEQRCPFFLPADRHPNIPTQYAGEPTFFCLDPNIPEEGEQLRRSMYGEGGCCYWVPDGEEAAAAAAAGGAAAVPGGTCFGSRLCLSAQCGAANRAAAAAMAAHGAPPGLLAAAPAGPVGAAGAGAVPRAPRCPAPGWPPPPPPAGPGRGQSFGGRLAYSACPPRPRPSAAPPARGPSLLLSILLLLLLLLFLGDSCCWGRAGTGAAGRATAPGS